jgi:hypothetical protein
MVSVSRNDLTQPGTQVDEQLWQQFRQDVAERRGGVRGHLRHELENALREYLEASKGGDINDRLRRIENNVEQLSEQVGANVDDSKRKKKKDSSVSQTVENRLDAIESQIQREIGDADKAHVSVVNKAIEDNAGGSRPTLDRYKEMLEQRHIAHEWPSEDSNTWWFDSEQFVQVVENAFPQRNDEFAQRYGQEWWDNKRPENDETEVGFQ